MRRAGLVQRLQAREDRRSIFAHFPVPTITVSTIEVKPEHWTPGIDAVGTVSAANGVDVAGQVGGVVQKINFEANAHVKKGQVLVQLDDSVERAGLMAAKSSVAVAQDALDRTRQLFNSNIATTAELQAAQNKLDQAQGALAQIEATLAQKAIKAPFDGTVGIPKVDPGQFMPAGTAIATLQDLSKMRVDFTVPEQDLPQISLGQPVEPRPQRRITSISRAPSPASTRRSTRPRVWSRSRRWSTIPRARCVPASSPACASILPEEDNVIALPQTAVVISLYGSYVYQVVDAPPPKDGGTARQGAGAAGGQGAGDGKPAEPKLQAKQVFVDTGRRSGTEIEITKGVEPGMQIVTSGQNKLSNGSPVAVDNSVNPASAEYSLGRIAMGFSERFIRRPVLSTVFALLILLLGAQGITSMSIRQYPKVDETVITVTTVYPGASADVIQGFITSTIEKAVSSAEGVDYVTSSSALSTSTVSVHMRLNANPDKSLTEVIAKVQQVRGQLPSDAKDPVIQKGTGFAFALMYMAARSDNMNPQQLTEYLTRVIQPRFATVPGVADAQILGAAGIRHARMARLRWPWRRAR